MIDVLFRKLLCNLLHKIVYSGYFSMGGEFLQLSMIMWNFSWRKLCVRPNWASPTHSGSSTTCWCCTFLSYPTRKHSYHLQRAHYLLAAVHATVKCVQTAQPKEGGKGKVCTIKLKWEASWDMSLGYLWNLLACFMLMRLCAQSAWWVRHWQEQIQFHTCLLQKFCPQVFPLTDDDSMKSISESVDSLCRDGADTQYMQYLRKSCIISPQIH